MKEFTSEIKEVPSAQAKFSDNLDVVYTFFASTAHARPKEIDLDLQFSEARTVLRLVAFLEQYMGTSQRDREEGKIFLDRESKDKLAFIAEKMKSFLESAKTLQDIDPVNTQTIQELTNALTRLNIYTC